LSGGATFCKAALMVNLAVRWDPFLIWRNPNAAVFTPNFEITSLILNLDNLLRHGFHKLRPVSFGARGGFWKRDTLALL
jgi:hypothetical protein